MDKKYNFQYETNANGSYIVIKLRDDEDILRYQLDMILHNQIPYIIPFHIRHVDGEIYLSYYITSKQPLLKLLDRKKITLLQLLEILQGVCKALIDANRYLLNENSYLIKLDYLYVNPMTYEVSMIYLPIKVEDADIINNLRQLFNKLLLYVSVDEGSNDNYLHKLFLEINQDDFNLNNLLNETIDIKLKLISNCVEGVSHIQPIKAQQMEEDQKSIRSGNDCDAKKETKLSYSREKLILVFSQILILVIVALLMLEESIGVIRIDGLDWTRFLSICLIVGVFDYFVIKRLIKRTPSNIIKSSNKSIEKLKRPVVEEKIMSAKKSFEKENKTLRQSISNDTQFVKLEDIAFLSIIKAGVKENITILQPSFIIGKLKEQVDFVLEDKTISRLHAEICYKDGAYYIKDLNSKNGTYVNGERIESNKPFLLSNNDSISFAEQSLSFHRLEENPSLIKS